MTAWKLLKKNIEVGYRKRGKSMKATIMMVFEDVEYPYGTYNFNTEDERKFVNELAMKIGNERDCQTYVKEVIE